MDPTNLTAKTNQITNVKKYKHYIQKFSSLSVSELEKILESKSFFLNNMRLKAARNVLKSRGMNRSRHNLPVFLIDKVILSELKQGKIDLSYFQKILGTTEERDDMKGQIVDVEKSSILTSDKPMTPDEAIRTLKTIRQILKLNVPKLKTALGSFGAAAYMIGPTALMGAVAGPQSIGGLPLVIFVAISIGGSILYRRYTILELIKKIDSILNSIPLAYEENPYLNISRKQNLRNKLKNEINANSQEISRLPNSVMPSRTRFNRKGGRKTRRNMRGGGLREDALAYLKKEGKEPSQLLFELHKRNPNGSYTATTKTMGGFTFKSYGHPAQSMTLKAKKENNTNDKYKNIFSFSDH